MKEGKQAGRQDGKKGEPRWPSVLLFAQGANEVSLLPFEASLSLQDGARVWRPDRNQVGGFERGGLGSSGTLSGSSPVAAGLQSLSRLRPWQRYGLRWRSKRWPDILPKAQVARTYI